MEKGPATVELLCRVEGGREAVVEVQGAVGDLVSSMAGKATERVSEHAAGALVAVVGGSEALQKEAVATGVVTHLLLMVQSGCSNLKLSSESLSAMIHVSVLNRYSADAQSLILRMVRRRGTSRSQIVDALISTYHGCNSNPSVFDLLIRTYVQARKLREATEAFRVLKERHVLVSVNACNSLLAGLVRVDWLEMAWDLYREVVEIGTCVNVYTLNIIVNALCKEGRFEMLHHGCFPDVVTYNAMLNGMCKEGRLSDANMLVKEMVERRFTPDYYTFTTLIHGYCRDGSMEEAFNLFNTMLSKHVKPDVVTYNTLIGGF